MARADRSAPNETAKSDNPGPLLRDYSVEDPRDGIAVVDSRSGPQEVATGDFIPGAGRVLRIEKRRGDWFVLTSRGGIWRTFRAKAEIRSLANGTAARSAFRASTAWWMASLSASMSS